jgi:FkbM family methyltransferase
MVMQNKSFIKKVTKGIQKRLTQYFTNPYRDVNLNWFTIKYYKHLPNGKLRKHQLYGKSLYFISPIELLHGIQEIFLDQIYKQNLPAKPYIIDCGANIGLSVIYLKHLYPHAEILAFEPDEKNFELLAKNIQSFGLDNVTPRKEAVWIENTTLKFASEGSMASKIADDHSLNTQEVKATRLKDLLNREVDFLKIDIEGAEYQVLCDIDEKLANVNNLFVEYHGLFSQCEELTKLFALFTKNGFSYYIKEARPVYDSPFTKQKDYAIPLDLQLNIFCFKP